MGSLLVVAVGLWILPTAYAKKSERSHNLPGADLFTNGPVLRIHLELDKSALDAMRRDDHRPVPVRVLEVSRGRTNIYTDVALHLKGAAGSRRAIDDAKPAFTLSFEKFTPDQRFHGLTKIHLNNSVQDPSYSTEDLCGELFNAAGVPAPRVTHARVWLNGRDCGFYTLIEGFAKEFLGIHFKKTKGNLYDGGFLRDVTDPLDRNSGDGPDHHEDLKALAAAAQEPNLAKRWEELQSVLDVERFAKFLALEILIWDWDGYARNRNNYRIYHDPASDKMVFLPHGMDQMFWEANQSVLKPDFGGLVASAFYAVPEGRALYRYYAREIFTNVFRVEYMTNRLEEVFSRNQRAVAELGPGPLHEYAGALNTVRDRVAARWRSVAKELGTAPAPMLAFNSGVARLPGEVWKPAEERRTEKNAAQLERAQVDGRTALHILAFTNSTASWRVRVGLDVGHYRFQALAKTSGVVPLPGKAAAPRQRDDDASVVAGAPLPPKTEDKKGEGAGIRLSMTPKPRTNRLVGDTNWTLLENEFDVLVASDDVELVCELRAAQGRVWFDADSLKLLKAR